MKNFFTIFFLFSFLFICLFSCKNYDLEQVDFIQISIVSHTLIGIDSVKLSAKLEGLVTGKPVEYGFLYKLYDEPIPIEFGKRITISETKSDKTFETTLSLDPLSQYNIAAFAETAEGVLYIDSLPPLNTGGASVSTESFNYTGGFEIELKGHLNNTNSGVIAVKHGFCWGYKSEEGPVLQDTNFINLGNRSNDLTFTAHPQVFQKEDDGIPFQFRAFAVFSFNFQLDTVYDENKDNWIEFDGDINYWLPAASLEEGWGRDVAFSFESNGIGYYGGGHTDISLLQYDPNDGLLGSWSDITNSYQQNGDVECPGETRATKRAAATSFTIGNKGYMGLGFCSEQPQEKQIDFWEFDRIDKKLTRVENFPGEKRVAAVGLSIGNKGYVGTGLSVPFLSALTDFYEFDPSGGSSGQDFWKEMEEFPDSDLRSAVGFSIGEKGYIGLGEGNDKFYEFDPNGGDDDNDGKDGKWRELENFPGGIRRDGVGFGMGAKGYVGLGRDDLYYSDFYEFDPNGGVIDFNGLPKGTWTRKADYPGPGRTLGEGFVIDEKIYLGAGKIEGPICQFSNPCPAIDFWVFHR